MNELLERGVRTKGGFMSSRLVRLVGDEEGDGYCVICRKDGLKVQEGM